MLNNKKRSKNNLGFSLVEVLLAVVLLGLIAAPILQMFYSSMAVNKKSKRYLAAADLAQSTVEAISAQTYKGSTGKIKVSATDPETGGVILVDSPVEVQGLEAYYNSSLTKGTIMPLYQVMTFKRDNVEDEESGGSVEVKTPYSVTNGPDAILCNDYPTDKFYFSNIEYAGYTFNVRISFNTEYEGENASSKTYFVVGVTVDVCDYAEGIVFTEDSIKNGTTPLIESVSTTVANTR